jgi:hypothetical protein
MVKKIDFTKRLSIVALSFGFFLTSCDTGGGGGGTTGLIYPLKVSSSGRYLVNQNNVPSLMIGDDAASLMVNVSLSDADYYLASRASQGFNAVSIELICDGYGGGRADASTFDGLEPFTTAGDLSTPNEAYFTRCDEMIRSAANHGITVMLNPAEAAGFISMLRANGVDKCKAYGRYLGNRYNSFDNLIWKSGCDFQTWSDPSDNALVKAIASGIKETDSRHIHTLQLDSPASSSLDDTLWSDVVALNAAYTYYPAYAEILKDYNRTPVVPVFLDESDYEFENGSDPDRLRRQEYWSFLAGACGYIYGNTYVWPMIDGWKDNLDTTGASQLGYCKALFQSSSWYILVPDQMHTLVTAGYGTYWSGGTPHSGISLNDYVTAASTPDDKCALAYIPTARTITVDLTRLSGTITARWYDPTAGTYQPITGSPFLNTASQTFTTPGVHADGAGDWVLVLEVQ